MCAIAVLPAVALLAVRWLTHLPSNRSMNPSTRLERT
jgi:hypothetical protein